jgi:phage shock protein A
MNEEYKKLVEAIDIREKDKTDEESLEDWSKRVEAAIESGDQKIRFFADSYKMYIPDFEKYKEAKIQEYKKNIETIELELKAEITEEDVNKITEEILTGFDEYGELIKTIE